jgi:DNA-binding MarR family transcriptional regulator
MTSRNPQAPDQAVGERLEREVKRLSERLQRLEETARTGASPPLERVQDLIQRQHARDALFEPGLFGDPTWDILLEIYRTELECRTTFPRELGRATGHPQTSVLRWVSRLEAAGLVFRKNDGSSSWRVRLALTPDGLASMDKAVDLLSR